jgi:WD40 repeat protein
MTHLKSKDIIDVGLVCIVKNMLLIGAEIFCMRYSPDKKYLAVGCNDGGTRLYLTSNHKFLYGFNMLPNGYPITSLRFRPTKTDTSPALLTIGFMFNFIYILFLKMLKVFYLIIILQVEKLLFFFTLTFFFSFFTQ